MIDAIVILILLGLLAVLTIQQKNERKIYDNMLEALNVSLAVAEANYTHLLDRLKEKSLTGRGKVAQTETERPMSGPQLRRLNERLNNAQWEQMQERPNSEVLKDQEA